MISPPIVGVPDLDLWDSGPSSLMTWPTFRRISAAIIPGANTIDTQNAAINGTAMKTISGGCKQDLHDFLHSYRP